MKAEVLGPGPALRFGTQGAGEAGNTVGSKSCEFVLQSEMHFGYLGALTAAGEVVLRVVRQIGSSACLANWFPLRRHPSPLGNATTLQVAQGQALVPLTPTRHRQG